MYTPSTLFGHTFLIFAKKKYFSFPFYGPCLYIKRSIFGKGSRKKSSSTSGPTTKRGGEEGLTTKEKEL